MCQLPRNEKRASVELGDVFRLHADAYSQTHTLTTEQYKVINAIKNCRTSALGGHVEQCDCCSAIHCAYNSCRNRHCPKCESFKAAKWLESRQAELLPVSYFHLVFTLPHELNHLILYNKQPLYGLLFSAVWKTINTLGNDTKRLGGAMGMLAILHTWGQNLSQHNHLHCIVPGGGLKLNGEWQSAKKKYLFSVQVMSKLFAGIYLAHLEEAYQNNEIKLPKQMSAGDFRQIVAKLRRKNWVVYAKPPFAGPEKLLNYLGRYTHKIAISNHRILACDEDSVTFQWRDYADANKVKVMKLKSDEFIRRFLSHVLPSGFMRIRSFGFLANASKRKKLDKVRKALNCKPTKSIEKRDTAALMLELTGQDITLCQVCKKGKLRRIHEIPSKFNTTLFDTS